MTDFADTIASIHRVVVLLAELDDPAATATAHVLRGWLGGQTIEAAANLPTDWRSRLRIATRYQALAVLVPKLSVASTKDKDLAQALHRLVQKELAYPSAVRPDGVLGYVFDLARAGCPGERHLRRLIAEIRGHQVAGHGHDVPAPSAAKSDRRFEESHDQEGASVKAGQERKRALVGPRAASEPGQLHEPSTDAATRGAKAPTPVARKGR
jgi:hypothetical protein